MGRTTLLKKRAKKNNKNTAKKIIKKKGVGMRNRKKFVKATSINIRTRHHSTREETSGIVDNALYKKCMYLNKHPEMYDDALFACDNMCVKKWNFCKKHGGKKTCLFPGCEKAVGKFTLGQYCSEHSCSEQEKSNATTHNCRKEKDRLQEENDRLREENDRLQERVDLYDSPIEDGSFSKKGKKRARFEEEESVCEDSSSEDMTRRGDDDTRPKTIALPRDNNILTERFDKRESKRARRCYVMIECEDETAVAESKNDPDYVFESEEDTYESDDYESDDYESDDHESDDNK